MPFPVIALGLWELCGWLITIFAGGWAAGQFADGKTFDEIKREIEKKILEWIVSYAASSAGLKLDEDAPLSDASFCNAIFERTGIRLRTLKDKQTIREDIESYTAEIVSQKIGYKINSVSDVNVLKADFMRIGSAMLSDKLGLPVGVLPGEGEELNPQVVKDRLLAWARAELLQRMTEEFAGAMDNIRDFGDFESLSAEMNGKLQALGSGEAVTGRKLALLVANRLATNAVADYGRVATGMSKRTRRQLQLRDAQKKFRATHGNRQQYVPLGMTAVVS